MNMKKTTAGVLASVVAVSAMATLAASAKEVSYAAVEKTFATSWKGYKSKEVKVNETGKLGALKAVADDQDTKINLTFETNTNVIVKEPKITLKRAGVLSSYDLTITEAKTAEGEVIANKFVADLGKIPADTDATDYDVTISYKITSTVSPVLDSDVAKRAYEVKLTAAQESGVAAAATVNKAIATALNGFTKNDKFDAEEVTSYIEIENSQIANAGDSTEVGVVKQAHLDSYYNGLTATIAKTLEGRTKAQVILNFEDPKLTNNVVGLYYGVYDQNIAGNGIQVALKAEGKNFTNVAKAVNFDTKTNTAVFDWGEITKAMTSKNNLSDISYDLSDLSVSFVSSANVKKLKLKSITVKGEAETRTILAAGEDKKDDATAVTTTAATAVETTTAAPAAETTTAAAANPKTGNAPIALAVIPVALAAAAVIAKKRG